MSEIDSLNRRVDDLRSEMKTGFENITTLLTVKDENVSSKIKEMKEFDIQHDKRIVKLEKSDSANTARTGMVTGIISFLGVIGLFIKDWFFK